MFDDNFLIRRDFLTDERALRRRFRFMAVANVLVRAIAEKESREKTFSKPARLFVPISSEPAY